VEPKKKPQVQNALAKVSVAVKPVTLMFRIPSEDSDSSEQSEGAKASDVNIKEEESESESESESDSDKPIVPNVDEPPCEPISSILIALALATLVHLMILDNYSNYLEGL
jgi:hypothetical protein